MTKVTSVLAASVMAFSIYNGAAKAAVVGPDSYAPFSGTFTIDPTIPFDPITNTFHGIIGTIEANVGGRSMTASIDIAQAFVPSGRWFLGGYDDITLDGVAGSGYIDIFLYGSTTSTGSILPQPFSAYTSSEFTFAVVVGPDIFEGSSAITSLVQRDNSTTFDFNGTFPSSVPEPSTWAMMLIGFAGIGAMAYRRKSKPALETCPITVAIRNGEGDVG
jgi:hypothetical protein